MGYGSPTWLPSSPVVKVKAAHLPRAVPKLASPARHSDERLFIRVRKRDLHRFKKPRVLPRPRPSWQSAEDEAWIAEYSMNGLRHEHVRVAAIQRGAGSIGLRLPCSDTQRDGVNTCDQWCSTK